MVIQRPSSGQAILQFTQGTVQLTDHGFQIGNRTIENPGEYDVSGIGFEVGEGHALLHADGLRVLVIEPTHPKLSAETVTALEGIELVVAPAEATPEQQRALASLLHDLEPRGVVILGSAEQAKRITGKSVEEQPKLKVQPSDFVDEELRVWAVA